MSVKEFETLVDDPKLKAIYFAKLDMEPYQVPATYEQELKRLLGTQVTLIGGIDSPEDYKAMLRALAILQAARDETALKLFHIKSLLYTFEQIRKQAVNYVERAHYGYLSQVKDSLRKQAIESAMEPLDNRIEHLEHTKDLVALVMKRLEDVNWTVKTSSDMVTEYFNNCKALGQWQTKNL